MHVYPLYRLNRPVAAAIIMAAAIIGALVAPIRLVCDDRCYRASDVGCGQQPGVSGRSGSDRDRSAAARYPGPGRDSALLAAGCAVSKRCAEPPAASSRLWRDMDRPKRW